MPPEPDNKMDELLRTYARKRRQDAGSTPELHPVNRRLLQAEAAKLLPNAPRRSTLWMRVVASWPRIAIATGLFAVLALILWNVVPTRQDVARDNSPAPTPMELASKKREEPAATATPAPANQPQPAARSSEELRPQPSGATRGLKLTNAALNDELARRTDQDHAAPGGAPANMRAFGEKKASDPSDGAVQLRSFTKPQAANAPSKSVEDSKNRGSVSDPNSVIAGLDVNSRSLPKLKAADQSGPVPTGPNFVFNGGNGTQLASKEYTQKGGALPPQGQVAETEMLIARERALVRSKQVEAISPPPTPAAPSLALPATTPPPALAPQPTRGRLPVTATDALAVTPPPAGLAGSTSLASAGQRLEPQPNIVWRTRYSRQPAVVTALQKEIEPAAAAPLTTFEFEQSGNDIRVIDQDGSVYAGRVVTAEDKVETEARLGEMEFEAKDKALTPEIQQRRTPVETDSARRFRAATPEARTTNTPIVSNAHVTFRVVGTNRTLGQRVTFEGTYNTAAYSYSSPDRFAKGAAPIPPAPRARLAATTTAPAPAATQLNAPTMYFSDSYSASTNSLKSLQLVGRMRIGPSNANAVTILALPAAK